MQGSKDVFLEAGLTLPSPGSAGAVNEPVSTRVSGCTSQPAQGLQLGLTWEEESASSWGQGAASATFLVAPFLLSRPAVTADTLPFTRHTRGTSGGDGSCPLEVVFGAGARPTLLPGQVTVGSSKVPELLTKGTLCCFLRPHTCDQRICGPGAPQPSRTGVFHLLPTRKEAPPVHGTRAQIIAVTAPGGAAGGGWVVPPPESLWSTALCQGCRGPGVVTLLSRGR